jgi:hypothetical protein
MHQPAHCDRNVRTSPAAAHPAKASSAALSAALSASCHFHRACGGGERGRVCARAFARSSGHQPVVGTPCAPCSRTYRRTDAMAVLSAQILLAACSMSSFFPPQSSPS